MRAGNADTLVIRHNGKDTTISQLSREYGLTRGCLQSRYKAGDRGDDLVRPARVMAAGHGKSKVMDLTPVDRSYEVLVRQWNEAMGGVE